MPAAVVVSSLPDLSPLLLALVSLVADEDEAASFPPDDERRVGGGLPAPASPIEAAPSEAAAGTAAPPVPVPVAVPDADKDAASAVVSSSLNATPEEDDNRRLFLGLAPASALLVDVPVLTIPEAPAARAAPNVDGLELFPPPDSATAASPAVAAAADWESPSLLPLSSLDRVRAWIVAARFCSSRIRVRSSL